MNEKTSQIELTYLISCVCRNCGHKWAHPFQKGLRKSETVDCPYCGCREGKPMGKPENDLYKSGFTSTVW